MDVIATMAVKSGGTRNPFSIVAPMSRNFPAFKGAGAVGGTGTGQYNYDANPLDPTKSTPGSTGTDIYSQIPGLVEATGNAIAGVVNAAKTSPSLQSSIQPLSTPTPTPVTTSGPLGVPVPYWIGGAAAVAGIAWFLKKGRRR